MREYIKPFLLVLFNNAFLLMLNTKEVAQHLWSIILFVALWFWTFAMLVVRMRYSKVSDEKKLTKIMRSKWSKRILWSCILLPFIVFEYIFLFVGTANTRIDDVCLPIIIISMIVYLVRHFLIDYWEYNKHIN